MSASGAVGHRDVGHEVPVRVGRRRHPAVAVDERACRPAAGEHHDRRRRPPRPRRQRGCTLSSTPDACGRTAVTSAPRSGSGATAPSTASVSACGRVATNGKRVESRSKRTMPSTWSPDARLAARHPQRLLEQPLGDPGLLQRGEHRRVHADRAGARGRASARRSSSRTSTPRRTSSAASRAPTGPAPTTTTSVTGGAGCDREHAEAERALDPPRRTEHARRARRAVAAADGAQSVGAQERTRSERGDPDRVQPRTRGDSARCRSAARCRARVAATPR